MVPGGRAALFAGALLAVALVAWPRAAHAQIVNVQSLVGQDLPEGFSGNLDAGADWRTGNTELLLVQGAATLRYKHEDHLVFAVVRGAYSRVGTGADEEQIIGNTFEHLRYRWRLTPLVTAEAFGQHEFDEFRRLQLRALFGVGPRLTILEQKTVGLVVGVAYMFEYQELDRKAEVADAGRTSRRAGSRPTSCSPARSTTWSPSSTPSTTSPRSSARATSASSTRPCCR